MAENLVLGKGKVYFAPYAHGTTTGGTKGFFGDVPEFGLAQNVTNLDHYSSTGGLKVKDRTVQLQTDATITFSTNNITSPNLMLWFGGNNTDTPPTDAPGDIGSVLFVGSANQIYGALFYESDNPVGDNVNYWFPYVALRPNGNFALIGDTWQTLGFIGEALKRDSATQRLYAYTPTGGATTSDAALDITPTYLTDSQVSASSGTGGGGGGGGGGASPATGGTVTATGGVHSASSSVGYTLTGGTLGWIFYHDGSANVGSAHAVTGASGTATTTLPSSAGTYTAKLYGNVGGTGSVLATSSSITVS